MVYIELFNEIYRSATSKLDKLTKKIISVINRVFKKVFALCYRLKRFVDARNE